MYSLCISCFNMPYSKGVISSPEPKAQVEVS